MGRVTTEIEVDLSEFEIEDLVDEVQSAGYVVIDAIDFRGLENDARHRSPADALRELDRALPKLGPFLDIVIRKLEAKS